MNHTDMSSGVFYDVMFMKKKHSIIIINAKLLYVYIWNTRVIHILPNIPMLDQNIYQSLDYQQE